MEFLDFERRLYAADITEGRSLGAYRTILDLVPLAEIINVEPLERRRTLSQYYLRMGYLSPTFSLLGALLDPERYPPRAPLHPLPHCGFGKRRPCVRTVRFALYSDDDPNTKRLACLRHLTTAKGMRSRSVFPATYHGL